MTHPGLEPGTYRLRASFQIVYSVYMVVQGLSRPIYGSKIIYCVYCVYPVSFQMHPNCTQIGKGDLN